MAVPDRPADDDYAGFPQRHLQSPPPDEPDRPTISRWHRCRMTVWGDAFGAAGVMSVLGGAQEYQDRRCVTCNKVERRPILDGKPQ